MKRIFLLLCIALLSLTACSVKYYIMHETCECLSSNNIVNYKGKKYTVINDRLYSLDNNSLYEIARTIIYDGAWDYIENVYSYNANLVIINSNDLYFTDETLNAQFCFSNFKTSSLQWVQIYDRLYFLDDDVNCRNLAYFDINEGEKKLVLKDAKKGSTYVVDENTFYIDHEFNLCLVKEDMIYDTKTNEVDLYLLPYGEISLRIKNDSLLVNDKVYEIKDNMTLFSRIECHKNYLYFALYNYKCDCVSNYNCLCNYNDIMLYRYNLDNYNLEKLSNLPSQSFIVNMCPLVYYSDNKIIKDNERILDFEITLGNEYCLDKSEMRNVRINKYAMIYDGDIYASKI